MKSFSDRDPGMCFISDLCGERIQSLYESTASYYDMPYRLKSPLPYLQMFHFYKQKYNLLVVADIWLM